MNYIQFDFEINNEINSDTLLAVLANLNFNGFEETGSLLKAFIAEEDFNEEMITEVISLFGPLKFNRNIVENINWNAEWEANFQPVLIDDFVGIRAHFHPPLKNVTYEIIITPKMSFGTGHHSTTYMIVQLMKQLDISSKSLIDFGTGTGVLAILARKAGAGLVVAVDNDEWSIENARENFGQNETPDIELIQHDTLPGDRTFDIILANINLNIILKNMEVLAKALCNNGTLLLSGFLPADLPTIKQALISNKLTFENSIEHNNWTAVRACKHY